jgi:hypothetical protein
LSGSITGGTVVSGDGTVLTGGTLDGVTLGNALNPNFTTSGTINFNNGVTLGAGATVNMGTSAWRFTPGGGTQTIGTRGQRHHQHRGRHAPGGVWRRADACRSQRHHDPGPRHAEPELRLDHQQCRHHQGEHRQVRASTSARRASATAAR